PSNGHWGYNNPIPGGGGNDYAIVVTGTLHVFTAGTFTFDSGSDDGSRLVIDGSNVVVNDRLQPFTDLFGNKALTVGDHSFVWTGYQRGGAAGFELSVKVGASQTAPITTANGWHVIGDPNPDPAISLSGTMSVTAYYSTLN